MKRNILIRDGKEFTTVYFEIPSDLNSVLTALSKKKETTKKAIVIHAITEYIKINGVSHD